MSSYYINLKLFMRNKVVSNIIWVLNNFLTMQCYRKICNQFYWKKLTPGTASYKTRLWIIILTALSAVWLAFFFDPTDPTSSISFSLIISLLAKSFRKIDYSIHSVTKNIDKNLNQIKNLVAHHILDSGNIFLWRSQETYFRTSSLLI